MYLVLSVGLLIVFASFYFEGPAIFQNNFLKTISMKTLTNFTDYQEPLVYCSHKGVSENCQ
jgi:hypothetical protein